MIREDVYSALFSLLTTNLSGLGVKTFSRRFALWTDIPKSSQPAVIMAQSGESAIQNTLGVPAKFELDVNIWLYINAGESLQTIPATIYNPIIDAITDAIAPPVGDKQTLGMEDVSHCWVSGKIEIFDGALGSQVIVIIPIKILAV